MVAGLASAMVAGQGQAREASPRYWRCSTEECGFVYDSAVGDATQGIPPGTPFERLADTWSSPRCGNPKSAYRPA